MNIKSKNLPAKPTNGGIPANDKRDNIKIIKKNIWLFKYLISLKICILSIFRDKNILNINISINKYISILINIRLKPYSNT